MKTTLVSMGLSPLKRSGFVITALSYLPHRLQSVSSTRSTTSVQPGTPSPKPCNGASSTLQPGASAVNATTPTGRHGHRSASGKPCVGLTCALQEQMICPGRLASWLAALMGTSMPWALQVKQAHCAQVCIASCRHAKEPGADLKQLAFAPHHIGTAGTTHTCSRHLGSANSPTRAAATTRPSLLDSCTPTIGNQCCLTHVGVSFWSQAHEGLVISNQQSAAHRWIRPTHPIIVLHCSQARPHQPNAPPSLASL